MTLKFIDAWITINIQTNINIRNLFWNIKKQIFQWNFVGFFIKYFILKKIHWKICFLFNNKINRWAHESNYNLNSHIILFLTTFECTYNVFWLYFSVCMSVCKLAKLMIIFSLSKLNWIIFFPNTLTWTVQIWVWLKQHSLK